MNVPRSTETGTDRDAWLVQALRHAPDTQAAPPPTLDDAILREARAAAHAGPPVAAKGAAQLRGSQRSSNALATAWAWVARPQVAAGFASVVVAAVLGMSWWGRPFELDPTRTPDHVEPPPLTIDKPSARAMPMPMPMPMPTPQADGRAHAAAGEASPSPGDGAAPPLDERIAQRQSAAPTSVPGPMSMPGRTVGRSEPAGGDAATASDREDPSAFADRRSAAAAGADADPAVGSAALAPASPPAMQPRARESASTAAAGAASMPAPARTTTTPPMPPPTNEAAPSAAAASNGETLGALLASVAVQPGRWRWERAGTVRPMTAALQRWLARLDVAVAAARSEPSADAGLPQGPGETAVLRLYRDGALAATLRLDDAAAALVPGPSVRLRAADVAALKQSLDDATR